MKGNNNLSNIREAPVEKKGFSNIINQPAIRSMIEKSVGSKTDAARVVSTLISVVNATPKLQNCQAGTIISAALRGEVGMGLSVALGHYAIVPYGTVASFQLQAKGLKQLAIRSGKYSDIGFFEVRKGEYKGRDPLTRKPIFDWIEDEDERLDLPIVGYYGFYKLGEEDNNFFQCIYWTHEQVLKHADRYSKAFSIKKYKDLCAGKLSKEEAAKLAAGSPWYALPDSVPHQKMCMKTIALQLLNDGLAPLQIHQAVNAEIEQDRTGEPVIHADDVNVSFNNETGEVIDVVATDVSESDEIMPETNSKVEKVNSPKNAKAVSRSVSDSAEDVVDIFDDDAGFFD